MPVDTTNRNASLGARVLIIVLFAVLDSLYLLYHHVSVNYGFQYERSMCNLGGILDCDKVAQSPFAEIFGIPVASFALIYYCFFLVFIVLFDSATETDSDASRAFADGVTFLSFLTLPFTLLFACISFFVIGFVCISCSLLYLISFLLCVVSWRSSERSESLLDSFRRGVIAAIEVVVPISEKQSSGRRFFVQSFLRCGLFILLMCIVFLMPSALLAFWFEPKETGLEKYVDAWRKSVQHEIVVDQSDSAFKRDFILGEKNASLTVVVFSDFKCPFCRRASGYLESIVEKSEGRVRVVFKNYPIDSSCNPAIHGEGHGLSCQAAVMARCAGVFGHDQFWRMHDALFHLSWFAWNIEELLRLPEELSLPVEQFEKCMQDPKMLDRVKDDIRLGSELKIQGTPSLYVNGRKLSFSGLENLPGLIKEILRNEET